MIEIASAHGMRVQLDAAEVHDPGEARSIVDDDFLRRAPGRERQGDGPQPFRSIRRSPLLIERLAFGTVDESLEHDGTIPDPGERARSDGEVILDDLALGELYIPREVRLVGIADPDLATLDGEELCGVLSGSLCHLRPSALS